jgi:hypothetical protein
MKLQFILTLLFLTAFLTGCGGTGYPTYPTIEAKHKLISASEPGGEGSAELGLRLPLSRSSSLGVDVNGIVDYLQGTATVDSLAEQQALQDPWICFSASF